ncbi:MAG: hypothetical protein WCL11_05125 [Verrucomicrobiota bacterium]
MAEFINRQERMTGPGARILFTPCTLSGSLVQATPETARNATSGDVALLSPAYSSIDQFRNRQHRSEVLCPAVESTGGGVHVGTPNIDGE